MSYDSNTKVALLNERFSKLLLVAFSSGLVPGGNSKLTKLLHEYRGVEGEKRYSQVVNGLVSALYLSEVSTAYYDGKKIVFGTHGWYRNVNFIFTPHEGKIEVVDGEVLISTQLPASLHEHCYMVKEIADEILGKSKDFRAVPSKNGHKVDRRYK